MKNVKYLVILATTTSLLVGCAENGGINKQNTGALIGAVGGAILGSNVGKGKGNIAAIALGTLGGAMIGSSIGASLDKADMAHMNRTSQSTLESARTGQTVDWRNPDSGHFGSVTPIRTFQTNDGRYCREYNQTVTVGGKTERAYGKACRQPDGSWQLVQ